MAYVYTHTRLDNNTVFYVGIGSDSDYTRANSVKGRNPFWYRVIKKTDYKIDIVVDGLSWEDVCEKEKNLIKEYGRRDQKKGTLVNLTDGGEGSLNLSEKVRKIISEKVIKTVSGKTYRERYGEEKALELKQRRSDRQKEVWKSRSRAEINSITNKISKNSAGKTKVQPKVECPHCGKTGSTGLMKRWHFDKCTTLTKSVRTLTEKHKAALRKSKQYKKV